MENRQRTIRKLLWRITAVLAVLAVVSICFVSGTFARYVSNRSGSTETKVAKWDIDFTDGTKPVTNNFTVTVGKLSPDMSEFGTLDDDDKQSAGDGYPGQRVKTTDAVLALQITNSGDVDAYLTITPPEKNSLTFYGYNADGKISWGNGFAIGGDGTITAPSLDEAREVITMQFALTTTQNPDETDWKSLDDINFGSEAKPLTLKAKSESGETSKYYFYVRSVWTSQDSEYYSEYYSKYYETDSTTAAAKAAAMAAAMSDGLDTWLGENIAKLGGEFSFSVVQASELPT